MFTEEYEIPEQLWINLFQTAEGTNVSSKLFLLHSEDKSIAIDVAHEQFKITVKKASEVGDNFASDVYRIIITAEKFKGREISTFAKVLPKQRGFRNVARLGKTHDREIRVYQDLLPLFLRTMQGCEGVVLKVPKLYYSRLDETQTLPDIGDRSPFDFLFEYLPEDGSERILVVEDLKPNNYVMQPKANGHCLDSVKKTLTALAHWHAIGCAMLKKLGSPPPGMDFFLEKTVYDQNGGMFQEMLETQKTVLDKTGEPELGQRLAELAKKIEESLGQSKPGTQGVLETIIHGDFWNNNILYKFSDDGKVEDLMMIDFQIARIGHPCDDLGFYLFGNTTSEFRQENLSDVIHHYYSEVSGTLVKLGFDIEKDYGYSMEVFLKEWNDRLLRMFVYGFIVTASVMSKKEDVKTAMDKGDDLIEELAQMLASIPDEKQREAMKKQIQEKGKEDNFMGNPDLLLKNKEFIERFLGLVREVLLQVPLP